MTKTTIAALPDPSGFSPDPLTEILRSGARDLIQQAVEAELAALLEAHIAEKTEDGHARFVRHGHLPGREVMTDCPTLCGTLPHDQVTQEARAIIDGKRHA